MKILHTADWHIGSFKGPEKEGVNLRSEDTMKCLRSLVETAEKEKPDLVLVSGDIFHQAEIWQGRSHKEVLQAREIILALSRAAGQVIVMRGTPNHDSEEAFLELKAHFEFIDNVKIVITPELVRTSYADIVAVPGFDKGTFRAQHPGISKEDENIVFSEELGKIVVGMRAMCSGDVPAILMSHYTVPGCNTESGQTQFLTQFEPVITQDMLLAADYDLVALGHIHRPQMINGLRNVYYSGAVNAMNFNDEGQDRGFWLYEMKRFSNEKWDISDAWFRKTPYREFITFHFTDTDITAINLGHIEEVAFNYWTYNGAVADKIVRVLYTCSAEQKKIFNTALLEKALYEAGAFWVAGIEAEKIESANRTELSKQEDPETNLIQYLQEKLIEPNKIDSIVEKARPIIAKAKANSAVSEFFGTFVPKEIEVKNYRNYVEQYFSFEDISFCTINGSNGSGKSSLFMDAIVDCLYEEPREGTNTGWIRNDEKARSGSISFTFGLGDKMFRVVRTRTKSGKPTLNLSELLENEWVDRSKEKIADTQKEIIRLLGMDSLTFKACVLIMQDQYGLFLEAGKEERVGVLSNLLGLGIYGIMEDLAKDELGNLKRDIAKKRQTINIHSATIESYGKPEDEKTEIELELNTVSEDRNNLAKQKEDKSLLLRMQREAQERHDKVQASVSFLMKNGMLELNNTDEYLLTEVPETIGSETAGAERVRRFRNNKKALQCNPKRKADREKEYERCIKELGGDVEIPAKLFAIVTMALENNPDQDFLGKLYMQLNLGSHWHGQFFTPYDVCKMMSLITIGDTVRSKAEDRDYIAVSDPACGAGATLISAANTFKERGINYQEKVLFVGQDIDRVVGQMCYIQLSLLGCAGYICIADTIVNPVVGSVLQPDEQKGQEFWYTPLYYSNRWQMRIFIQNMKRLMPLPEAEQQKEDEYVFFFDFDKKEETYGNK